MSQRAKIATDGSCHGNPGPGGWAWVAIGGRNASGFERDTTNNRMELRAIIEGLRAHARVELVTALVDSRLVVNTITLWLPRWKSLGWKRLNAGEISNLDLVQELDAVLEARRLSGRAEPVIEHVRGHWANRLNREADRLANVAAVKARREVAPRTTGQQRSSTQKKARPRTLL